MKQGKINGDDFFTSNLLDCLDYVKQYMGDDFASVLHGYISNIENQLLAEIEDAQEEVDCLENNNDSLEDRVANLEETIADLETEILELKKGEL